MTKISKKKKKPLRLLRVGDLYLHHSTFGTNLMLVMECCSYVGKPPYEDERAYTVLYLDNQRPPQRLMEKRENPTIHYYSNDDWSYITLVARAKKPLARSRGSAKT